MVAQMDLISCSGRRLQHTQYNALLRYGPARIGPSGAFQGFSIVGWQAEPRRVCHPEITISGADMFEPETWGCHPEYSHGAGRRSGKGDLLSAWH